MNYIKKLGNSFVYLFIFFIILTFLFTLLNYVGLINYSVLRILNIITLVISIFIGSYMLGTRSNSKGWLEGLKLGIIMVLIFIIINYLIFRIVFNIKHIIYFSIILGTSMLGSILGINKKKEK